MNSADLFSAARAELEQVFEGCAIEPLVHPFQRNITLMIQGDGVRAVAKLYRYVSLQGVELIGFAENLVSESGVRIPNLLYQSKTLPLVVHEHIQGEHRRPVHQHDVNSCAEKFCSQLRALKNFQPSWAPARPVQPPNRARLAAEQAKDRFSRDLIFKLWAQLTDLDRSATLGASHTDWRCDNFLFGPHGLVAVLDWEAVVLIPPAEAAGYAAASFTHSWRDSLYTPFRLEAADIFTHAITRHLPTLVEGANAVQFRLALAFAGLVRLVEDQIRRIDQTSVGQIMGIL